MYEIIKQVILSGDYELSDMLNKIKKNCVRGDITDEQETELIALAREKATPENSYAGLPSQVDELRELLDETIGTVAILKQDVDAIKKALEEGGTDIPEPEPEPEPDKYPEYKQPTGAHDAYYKGDGITWKGKKYDCIEPDGVAVVWNPDEYPAYWKKVTEEPLYL